ncbi:uncharacterized protein A4U43_C03F6520 [Asparagus officinalis]|uniref:Uncharacterized protein n=1 Tax=Asparagus officinalis TaxID=4686 RepID=A0A5P1FCY1_ASPOF|nr:uncharacterized protein A4U43_C03F6520 [Asparagus officinalis]
MKKLASVALKGEEERIMKGYVPVLVGTGDEVERILVSVKVFKHRRMASLLEAAAEEFGFQQRGVLRIPCDVKYFRGVLELISAEIGEGRRERTKPDYWCN